MRPTPNMHNATAQMVTHDQINVLVKPDTASDDERESLLRECKQWIQGHAHLAGITASRKADELVRRINAHRR